MAKLNKGKAANTGREEIGRWISHAWTEAREGRTENWSFLSPAHEARLIEQRIVQEEMEPTNFGTFRLIRDLRASLSQLRSIGA